MKRVKPYFPTSQNDNNIGGGEINESRFEEVYLVAPTGGLECGVSKATTGSLRTVISSNNNPL